MRRLLTAAIAAAMGMFPALALSNGARAERGVSHRARNRRRNKLRTEVEACIQSDKRDSLPRGYPGAKMARKAAQGKIGKRA